LCEAKIYASYGENWRAMRSMKRAIPFYTSAPIDSIPMEYWRILFPQAYWSTIKSEADKNGLDPYMVAALIRQETEFNPAAISNKSAYGLMQLLPSVGKSMAKEEGIRHFSTNDLLDPDTNIRLGTRYLGKHLSDSTANRSTPSPPIMRATIVSPTGSPSATTVAWMSSLSRSPLLKLASTCRPSSATKRSTAPWATDRPRRKEHRPPTRQLQAAQIKSASSKQAGQTQP